MFNISRKVEDKILKSNLNSLQYNYIVYLKAHEIDKWYLLQLCIQDLIKLPSEVSNAIFADFNI